MAEKKWAYKPGEVTSTKNQSVRAEDFAKLVDEYTELVAGGKVIVINDHEEVVFFIQTDDGIQRASQTDVFLWDGVRYSGLPSVVSERITKAYFDYAEALSDAHDLLEEGQQK